MILFTRFPFESAQGGAENQTMWLADGLKKRGYHIKFMGSCPVLLERFSKNEYDTTTCDIGPPPVTLWNAISFLWRKKLMAQKMKTCLEEILKKINDAERTTIVMLSLTEKLLLTKWCAKKGMKVVWIEHDTVGCWLTKNPWLPFLKKSSLDATIVCVSHLSKTIYEGMGFESKNLTVIPNGIPQSNQITQEKMKNSGELHIGVVARLSPEKGMDVLIRAVENIPNLTVTIVGKGPQKNELLRLIEQDAISWKKKRIHLIEFAENLSAFYQSIDTLVLPSITNDPFGLVVAEAMMRRIAVIVSDACGIASYLQNNVNGCIVQAGSVESLQHAIEKINDDAWRNEIAKNGQQVAKKTFALERMVDSYEKIINSMY